MKEAFTINVTMLYDEDGDGILRMKILPNATIDLAETIDHYRVAQRLTGDKKVLVLVDASANYSITREAQRYAAEQSHTRIATAVISKNSFTRLSTNIYVSLFRPLSPIRIFLSEKEAIDWLNTFRSISGQ